MVRILLVVLAKLVVFVSEQSRSCADVLGTFLVSGVTLCTSAFLPGSAGVRLRSGVSDLWVSAKSKSLYFSPFSDDYSFLPLVKGVSPFLGTSSNLSHLQ